ncbi:DUF4272 domain-containing protein [Paenibacillus wulumuqiensis]|uniref:DUF4272 domain-containing protein n=1 Tax=Paenibacillus wulumuqiensis TaxID=1567107 RepID=UPI00061965C3|nr:DUF4272 domain-containing protein [Paenibacillus wulumuqiensis]
MKNAAIYSSIPHLQQLEEIIRTLYKDQKITVKQDLTHIEVVQGGLFHKKSRKGFNMMTSRTEPAQFSAMIDGMGGFFYQVPAVNKELQQKVLLKISTFNMVIGIETEEDISEAFFEELLQIVRSLDGVLFWGGGQLLDGQGRLLLDAEGRSGVEDYTVTAHTSYLHDEFRITPSGEIRKQRSNQWLESRCIPVNATLPALLGDELADGLRTRDEVAARAVAICITAVKGECVGAGETTEMTRELINRIIRQYDANRFFTPEEQAFIEQDQPGQEAAARFSWRYEALWVMLWALGHVDTLGEPTEICDVARTVGILQQFDSFAAFREGSRLREAAEILDAADLIYRYDWACVDSRVHQRPVPGGLDAGVVYERHYALNWLTGYLGQDWDHVRTDT